MTSGPIPSPGNNTIRSANSSLLSLQIFWVDHESARRHQKRMTAGSQLSWLDAARRVDPAPLLMPFKLVQRAHELLLEIHAAAWRLFAIAQRRIEDANSLVVHDLFSRERTAWASG